MNNTLNASTFLEKLRSATSQSHKNLEDLPVSLSIMNPAVTKQEYLLYLNLLRDVVKDAEINVFPALENIITDLQERKKSHLIDNDLKTLGIIAENGIKTQLSINAGGISTGYALGVFYVIEGSSLGGRVILKNINIALGYDASNGASYFAGYGGQTGSRWKDFLEMLQNFEAENEVAEEIIAGADFAFNAITAHFIQNS